MYHKSNNNSKPKSFKLCDCVSRIIVTSNMSKSTMDVFMKYKKRLNGCDVVSRNR